MMKNILTGFVVMTAGILFGRYTAPDPRPEYERVPITGVALEEIPTDAGILAIGVHDGINTAIQVDAKGHIKCKPDPKAEIACRCLSKKELSK